MIDRFKCYSTNTFRPSLWPHQFTATLNRLFQSLKVDQCIKFPMKTYSSTAACTAQQRQQVSHIDALQCRSVTIRLSSTSVLVVFSFRPAVLPSTVDPSDHYIPRKILLLHLWHCSETCWRLNSSQNYLLINFVTSSINITIKLCDLQVPLFGLYQYLSFM